MSMRDYSAEDLMELARDHGITNKVELGASGDFTGLVMPRDYSAGQLVDPNHARELAAQLLRAADLHDAIFERGHEAGFAQGQQNMTSG